MRAVFFLLFLGALAVDVVSLVTFVDCAGWWSLSLAVAASAAVGFLVLVYSVYYFRVIFVRAPSAENQWNGALLLLAGALLILPGVLTDGLGLLLLLPPVRKRAVGLICGVIR